MLKANHLLKRERELRGWSQARVADELGTSVVTIGRWERGLAFPYPYFREKLCILFGKDASALGLLSEDEAPPSSPLSAPETTPAPDAAALPVYDPVIPLPSTVGPGLVGRDELLSQLKQKLYAGSTVALSALNGLPGVGKTALAIQLAHDAQIRTHFGDGILWVGLGPYPNLEGQLSRWAHLLRIDASELLSKGLPALSATIRAVIGQRRILLVLDDAWTIEDALTFKVGGPECACLLTTRFPQVALHFAGEGATTVQELSQQESVTLLNRLLPPFVTRDTQAIHQLVDSVGGLPLALNLMGKYLRAQAYNQQPRRIKAALERLRQINERLQVSEPYAAVEQHSSLPPSEPLSLQSVIAASDQILSESARMALRALSVFPSKPSSFSEDAAIAIIEQPLEVLDALSDAGMLEGPAPGRYTLHQTIADYARTHLDDKQPFTRLIAYFTAFLKEHQRDYEMLQQEQENILAALQEARKQGQEMDFVSGVHGLMPFLRVRGLYTLAEDLLQQALAVDTIDPSARARSLGYCGGIANRRGENAQAEVFLLEGLALARKLADQEQVIDLLTQLGIATMKLDRLSEARDYLQEGLTLAQSLHDDRRISAALENLAIIKLKQGNYVQAERDFKELLDLARQLDDKERIATILPELGFAVGVQGLYEQEEQYLQEGLLIARELGHRYLMNMILINLASLACKRGNYTLSERSSQEALVLSRQLGDSESITILFSNLGWVADEQGYPAQAQTYYEEGLLFARKIGHPELICVLLENMSWLTIELGDDQQAQRSLQEGLELAEQAGLPEKQAAFLDLFGLLHYYAGDYAQAERFLQQSLMLIRQVKSAEYLGTVLIHLGQLAIKRGSAVEAETYITEGLQAARDLGTPQYICKALYEWGQWYLKERQVEQAAAVFRDMLAHVPAGNQKLTALAQYGLSRACAALGDLEEARRYVAASLAFFQESGQRLTGEILAWQETLS